MWTSVWCSGMTDKEQIEIILYNLIQSPLVLTNSQGLSYPPWTVSVCITLLKKQVFTYLLPPVLPFSKTISIPDLYFLFFHPIIPDNPDSISDQFIDLDSCKKCHLNAHGTPHAVLTPAKNPMPPNTNCHGLARLTHTSISSFE